MDCMPGVSSPKACPSAWPLGVRKSQLDNASPWFGVPKVIHCVGDADPLRRSQGRLQIQPAFGMADEINFRHPEISQYPGKNGFEHGRIGLDAGAVAEVVGAQAHEGRAESGLVGVVVHVVTRSGTRAVGPARSRGRWTVGGFQPVGITAGQPVHEYQHGGVRARVAPNGVDGVAP